MRVALNAPPASRTTEQAIADLAEAGIQASADPSIAKATAQDRELQGRRSPRILAAPDKLSLGTPRLFPRGGMGYAWARPANRLDLDP
jgi:hypothetical protein